MTELDPVTLHFKFCNLIKQKKQHSGKNKLFSSRNKFLGNLFAVATLFRRFNGFYSVKCVRNSFSD